MAERQFGRGVEVPKGVPEFSTMTHGGTSERILSVKSEILREVMFENYPWLIDADAVAIEQYCRAEARARILGDYILEVTMTEGAGQVPIGLWTASANSDMVAMRAATSLGLNPEGRMKIAKDAGFASQFQNQQLRDLTGRGKQLRGRE